jgi:hypothetical protein
MGYDFFLVSLRFRFGLLGAFQCRSDIFRLLDIFAVAAERLREKYG